MNWKEFVEKELLLLGADPEYITWFTHALAVGVIEKLINEIPETSGPGDNEPMALLVGIKQQLRDKWL